MKLPVNNPSIRYITIGVRDLEQMTRFYRETLGWKIKKEQTGISFFEMEGGLQFALYGADALAEDMHLDCSGMPELDPLAYKNMSLALNLGSEEEVDDYFDELMDAGVRVQRMPEKVFWGGYRGYFADPENNYWEVAYNPFL